MNTNYNIASSPNLVGQPDIEFRKNDFEGAIWKKGYRVIHSKALKCPCKSQATNHLSTCKNCGGIGWVFVNPILTRAILSSMNLSTQYKEWSEELLGMVNITMRDSEKLSYMDKIEVVDGQAWFNEVIVFRKTANDELVGFSTYKIKELEYAGEFITTTQPLNNITQDITVTDNILTLPSSYLSKLSNSINKQGIIVTIRYKHSPTFFIIDLKRELMNTFITENGREKSITMPVSAVGRRAHYIIDSENLYQTRLLDNGYQEKDCEDDKSTCI